MNRSDTGLVLSGVISGTGTLVQAGSGTSTLTANNTYSGTTTISAGILQLGNGGASGSVAGAITDNAQLALDRSDTGLVLAGVISGTGTLVQIGSGTSTLTGNNTYSGTTTISAGILQLGNGGTSGSVAGAITDNAQLTLNRSDTGLGAGRTDQRHRDLDSKTGQAPRS